MGLDCGQLRQEPAITGLDGLFTPIPRSEERLLPEPLQASTRFYPRFTLPRDRSPGFGSHSCNFRRFHTAQLACAACTSRELRMPFRLSSLHECTPWHVIQNARHNVAYHAVRFQTLCTPHLGFFSTFARATCTLSDSRRI